MNRIAGRAGITFLLALLLLAGFAFFLTEYVLQADDWVIFPGSPHVYNGGNIGCGVVTDRDNLLLLDLTGARTYSDSQLLRLSTVHWVGDRNGSISAPSLSYHASALAGFDLLNGVYSYGEAQGVAKLSLSGVAQAAALEAMGDRKGTVAVYNYKTGELLCAVTTPTYDPDHVPDIEQDTTGIYEGIFVNRFTQSAYTPGSIFKIVTLAAALEEDPSIVDQTFTCTGSMEFGVDTVTCLGTHWEQTMEEAFANSCNCAFAQIALQLGGETLERYVEQFRITEPVSFDGITTAAGNFEAADAAQVNVAWSGIGQYHDLVNPCAFMTFLGAIANGGKAVQPYVVDEINVGSAATWEAEAQTGPRLMSTKTARQLQALLQNNVETRYGSEWFPGLTVGAKTGTAEVGDEEKPNAMLAGFSADEEYPFAFVVAVENGGYGSTVCIPLISQVLAACKGAMD